MLPLALLLSCVTLAALGSAGRLSFLHAEFVDTRRRAAATGLLALLLVGLLYPVVSPERMIDVDPRQLWFPGLFVGHVLLLAFLVLWFGLAGSDSLRALLALGRTNVDDVRRGLWIGAAGWLLTVATMTALAPLFMAGGLAGDASGPPVFVLWLARLALWKKLLIIAMAMTVEELFFRGFLQPRIGLIPSSLLFAIAHASYGLPLMVLGVFVISLVLGWTLRSTGRLVPCMIAHGTFDAIQLLLVIPLALRALEAPGRLV